ncbi:MAG: hypothetical protein K2K40_06845 [Paramuribaculum sp.]|nr:hypothetical protein [Paramuribaculum sp.]MDE7151941.1 hypothetical protein [Candidatus Amulumruptor sp.]MDE7237614.1 hypothetical protein [Paramuribaculum sp.]
MKRNLRRLLLIFVIALLGAAPALTLQSCGTTHSYWGVESDYDWGDGGYHFAPGKHKKPKRHKPKHKKPKHHKHHDHDDDDD